MGAGAFSAIFSKTRPNVYRFGLRDKQKETKGTKGTKETKETKKIKETKETKETISIQFNFILVYWVSSG